MNSTTSSYDDLLLLTTMTNDTTITNDIDTDDSNMIIASSPGPILMGMLGIVIICLSFGLGSTLELDVVHQTLNSKVIFIPVLIGVSCQYIIMPLISYILIQLNNFSPAKSMGLLLCGISPGGSTSNLFTYWLNGNVSMSIIMTVSSYLLAIGMIPLLLYVYGTSILKEEDTDEDTNNEDTDTIVSLQAKNIPYKNIILLLIFVVIPTIGGIYLRSKSILWAKRAERSGSIIGAMFVIIALITGIIDNLTLFSSSIQTWMTSASLSILGFCISYFLCYIVFQFDSTISLTIGLEVGIQSTILSLILAFVIFSINTTTTDDDDESNTSNSKSTTTTQLLNEALIFPIMCSLWDIGNSVLISIIVLLSRKQSQQRQKQSNTTTTTTATSSSSSTPNEEEGGVGVPLPGGSCSGGDDGDVAGEEPGRRRE